MFRFPLFGAIIGLTLSIFITTATQIAYPLVTGGKPILSIFAMLIIMYEMTMLSAVVTTVVGIIFESRLPKFNLGAYDTRITEGLIGVVVNCEEKDLPKAKKVFKDSGALDTKEA